MATRAEYLGAWAGEGKQPEGGESARQPDRLPRILPNQPDNSHLWSVTVMRGDQVEVQSFELDLDKESGSVDRMN